MFNKRRCWDLALWALAVTATSALVIGVPLVLLIAGDGWPGPRSIPTATEFFEVFGPGGMSDARVLAFVVMMGWVTWFHLMYVFMVEFVAAVRGRTARRVRASALMQRFAQMLVAGLFRLGVTSTAVFGVVGPPAVVGLTAVVASPVGAQSSEVLDEGTVLVPEDLATDVTLEYYASSDTVSPRDGMVAFEVSEGDYLWRIAETHLGDGFRYVEIFEASKGFVQPGADGRIVSDPDLIWPGTILLLPGDAVGVTDVEESKVAAVYGRASVEVDVAVGEPDVEVESSPETVEVAPVPDVPEVPAVAEMAVEVEDAEASELVVDGPNRLSMSRIGFGATGVVICVGLVEVLRRARLRRQARLRRGEVPKGMREESRELEGEIRQGADHEFVSFVDSAWASLAQRPVHGDDAVVPVLASLDGDLLQVMLSGVDRSVFPPWSLQTDAGEFSVWELDRARWHSSVLPAPNPSGFPLLVPIAGKSFLNLEATGPISLLGDSERCAGFVRALCLERSGALHDGFDLAVSRAVADSIGVNGQDLSDVASKCEQWATAALAKLDAGGVSSSYEARSGVDAGEPFAKVIVCSADEVAVVGSVLSVCAERRLPLSVIVFGRCDAEFVIEIDALGEMVFGPSRMRDSEAAYVQHDLVPLVRELVEAHGQVEQLAEEQIGEPQVVAASPVLGPDTPRIVEDERLGMQETNWSEPLVGPFVSEPHEETSGLMLNDVISTGDVEVEAEGSTGEFEEPALDEAASDVSQVAAGEAIEELDLREVHDEAVVRVRVLGPVMVEGLDVDLTASELSLFTYLAINGEQTAATLRDALWGFEGISDKGWWQMSRRLRNKLSVDVFPTPDDGRFVLHGVTSDFYEFQEHVKRARRAGSANGRVDGYLDALELISGEPLRVQGREQFWSWVHSTEHGILNHIEVQIADAVRDCITAADEAGRLVDAAVACQQGLRASPLNEPVIEMYVEVLLAQGKHNAAQRQVEEYERRAFDLFDGEPSSGPRDVLMSRVA